MAGLAVGMKRPTVTEFSFLVGIPTMFAASAFDTFKAYKARELTGLGQHIIVDTIIGFFVSMVVAFFVVKWLLRFVQSHTFNGFAIYRVLLGGGLLIALYTGAIPDVTNEKEAKKAETPTLTATGTNTASIPPASAEPSTTTNTPTPEPIPAATNEPSREAAASRHQHAARAIEPRPSGAALEHVQGLGTHMEAVNGVVRATSCPDARSAQEARRGVKHFASKQDVSILVSSVL